MRPELLEFSGLRSYHGSARVDFTDLGLFAIVGDTGSGKSTIIEALSLALYARPTWTGHIDGLVSDGASAWQVELIFATGDRRWKVTRRRGRGASIDKLEELDGRGEKVDGALAVTARVAEIVGLTHGQFITSVVLPQGEFETLLVAGETTRGELLTSILGLDDIEATRRHAKQLLEEWDPKVQLWAGLRRDLGPDPAAALADAVAEAEDAARRAAELSEASTRCQALEPQLAAAHTARDTIERRLAALSDPPADAPSRLAATQQRWAENAQLTAVAEADLGRVEERAAELDSARTQHLAGFANRDELVEALSVARRVADQLPEKIERADQSRHLHAAACEDAPPDRIDETLVAAVEHAVAEVDAAEMELRAASTARQQGVALWQQLGETRSHVTRLEGQLPDATGALDSARQALEAAQRQLGNAEQAERNAVAATRAALVGSAADQAGAGCAPGDDCPVCARPLPEDYTPPEHHADVQAATDTEEAARRDVERARAHTAELTRALDRAAAATDRLHADIDTARSAEQQASTAAASAGVDTAAAGEDDGVAALTAAVSAAQRRLDAAREASTAALSARDAAQAALDRVSRDHQARVAQAAASAEQDARAVDDLVGELDRIDPPAGERLDPSERAAALLARLDLARATLEELAVQRRQLEDDGRDANERRSRAADCARDARDAARDLIGELRGHTGAVAQLRDAAATAAPGDELPELPEQLPAVSSPEDLAVVCARIEAHLAALDTTVDACRQAVAAAARHQDLLAEELQALLQTAECATAAELHGAAGAARAEAADAEESVARHRTAAGKAAALDARLASAEPFVANLRVLREALRNSRFVKHLVSARETELLTEASRRLSEITGGRFGFGAGFKVVNRHSGESRKPEALSGGERFQAALALALALMEIASRGSRGRLEAVFIDEGFGSLDGGALEQALDRLRSVSGDGTTVALVSHLRAVAEHVTDVLHVTRDDTTGSRITPLGAEELERMLDDDVRSGLTT